MEPYEPIRGYWDGVFARAPLADPHTPLPSDEIEAGLAWLCASGGRILDFGCGAGRLVLRCLALGANGAHGIDISDAAVESARSSAEQAGWSERAQFEAGGVEALPALPAASFDGAILSNILDNLLPYDARVVVGQVRRLLRPGGRLLVRLNPTFDPCEFRVEDGYVELEPGLYREPSGLLFWNLSDAGVEQLLGGAFTITRRVDLQQPPGRQYECQ